jgi:hypothetical protein
LQTTQNVGFRLSSQSSADAGIDLGVLKAVVPVVVDAQANATVSGNAIVTLVGGTSAIATVDLEGSASQAALVDVNASTSVTTWKAVVGSSKVDVKSSALVITNLQVAGSNMAIFQTSATSTSASVSIANLNWTSTGGILLVSGGSATIGISGSTEGTQSGSGEVRASGSVSIDGVLAAGVTLNVYAAGKSAPHAVIDAGKKLDFRGTTVSGSTGSQITVNGQFLVGASTNAVQPKVVVNSGAQFVVASSTALTAEALNVAAQGRFVLAANANRAAVRIKKIAQLAGTVEIKLNVTAAAFIASGGRGIGFTYDAAGNVAADLAKSTVVVTDSAGLSVTLKSSVGASASGRRLLADASANTQDNQANWGPDSMTFTMGSVSGASSMFAVSFVSSLIVLCLL